MNLNFLHLHLLGIAKRLCLESNFYQPVLKKPYHVAISLKDMPIQKRQYSEQHIHPGYSWPDMLSQWPLV